MHNLTIVNNILTPGSWVNLQTDNVIETLMQKYEVFPKYGRLYCGQVTKKNDVTPQCEEDIADIQKMKGDFWLIEYPAGTGLELLAYAALALIAVVAVVALTSKPKLPGTLARNYQSSSPNNDLSGRTNTARLNNRIPDIFGTVRSTPDLLAVPYSIFINHVEFEYCYMAVGRGAYDIPAAEIKDGSTISSNIEGESVEIFAPFTSPNTNTAPQLRIGTAIDRQVISAVRSKSVNGQTLRALNEAENVKPYSNQTSFTFPDKLNSTPQDVGLVKFVADYHVGDTVVVTTSAVGVGGNEQGANLVGTRAVTFNADKSISFPSGFLASLDGGPGGYLQITDATVGGYDFSGKYVINSYGSDKIVLEHPEYTSDGWNHITGSTASVNATFANTSNMSVDMSGVYSVIAVTDNYLQFSFPANIQASKGNWMWLRAGDYNGTDYSWGYGDDTVTVGQSLGVDNWVGTFILNLPTMNEVIANFVATNGMYADNGTAQTAVSVQIQLGVTPCTSIGVARGSEQFFTVTIVGSADVQSTRAATLFADVTGVGPFMVRARRLTPKNLSFNGTIVDEVKWRDVYGSSPVGNRHFGDVTTVHAVTQATQAALAVSERQLNMLVTRKLPARVGGSGFSAVLYPTNSAADIISFICLDPKLGNRKTSEVNFDNIYDTISAIQTYFGFAEAKEFSYTFDNDNMSFEEMLKAVCQAIFCTPQRRGQVIELAFEKATIDSAVLFNHRNKVPGSETRTTSFGQRNNNDGVEYTYVSPIDDAVVTVYLPEDRSAVNPLKIESVGVRNDNQAKLHAYREFNKLRYQVRSTQFDALQEAEILSINSRIQVADNTRPDTQDGEILSQSGLIIELSQPAVIDSAANYVISLQSISGIVQVIAIAGFIDPYHLLLAIAPANDLVTDDGAAMKTTYQLVKNTDRDTRSFLLTDKKQNSNFVTNITAINYDARYYQNDLDFHP